MSRPLRHQGAGMLEAPELLLRQILLEGLVELSGDAFRVDEIFERVDGLLQGSQESWADDFRASVRRMAQLGGAGGIRVGVGYPSNAGHLPYVSIVTGGAAENTGGATVGDVLHRGYEQLGVPTAADPASGRSVRHTVVGADWTTQLEAGVWAEAPEASIALHAVVRHLVFRHKGRLVEAGVREVSISEGGFTPAQEYQPRTMYVPTVRVSMDWTMRSTRRTSPVPTRVTMLPPRFSN